MRAASAPGLVVRIQAPPLSERCDVTPQLWNFSTDVFATFLRAAQRCHYAPTQFAAIQLRSQQHTELKSVPFLRFHIHEQFVSIIYYSR